MTQSSDRHNGHANGYGDGSSNGSSNGTPDRKGSAQHDRDATTPHYPLSDHPEQLKSAGGRSLDAITLDAVDQGELSAQDLQIGADTLLAQAEIARRSGFGELADNLTRAAELTAVPNQELLRMYETLRPHRATYEELLELAHTLESQYNAPVNAEFVREAAQVYQTRNLLRRS